MRSEGVFCSDDRVRPSEEISANTPGGVLLQMPPGVLGGAWPPQVPAGSAGTTVSPLQLNPMDLMGISLSHYAANFIREAILQGSLQPRERLIEARLANQLNLSRGPIRDALKQLEREGLIVILPRRGALVSHLAKSDVWEIASLRAVVEGLAARILAERKDEPTTERLETVLRDMAAVGDENPLWIGS